MKAKQPCISPIGVLLLICFAMTTLATSCKNGSPPLASNSSTPEPNKLTIGVKAKQIEAVILRGDLVNEDELLSLSPEELRILRNVVFARHGRQYEKPGLGDYFDTCDWYKPDPSYTDTSANNWLTENDKKNVKTFLRREEIAKQKPTQPPPSERPPTEPPPTPELPSSGPSSASLRIEYRYSPVAICESARATVGGMLVGEAKLLDLVRGQYYLVRETHYLPSSGNVIYEGQSRFAVAGGMKISEETIRGQKVIEIFRSWPSGARGF